MKKTEKGNDSPGSSDLLKRVRISYLLTSSLVISIQIINRGIAPARNVVAASQLAVRNVVYPPGPVTLNTNATTGGQELRIFLTRGIPEFKQTHSRRQWWLESRHLHSDRKEMRLLATITNNKKTT